MDEENPILARYMETPGENSPSASLNHSNSSILEIDLKRDLGDVTGSTPPLTPSPLGGGPGTRGAALAWRELSVYVTLKGGGLKRILNNVTGVVEPGTLVALMGPSGAGKSTLMAALGYRAPAGSVVQGEVLVDGRVPGEFMHRVSGFMHQEDLFIGCLTVLEHLTIMARLKMDRYCTTAARMRRVNSLLRRLGLWRVRHSRIGRAAQHLLSGGERKRLAFATELLTDPPLLFCDEPTSGLDSCSARGLVRMMTERAAAGGTVLCTIHQPASDVFAMFHRLILLADGRIAFSGTSEEALDFFHKLGYPCPMNYNPADLFIRVAADGYSGRVCDHFAVSAAAAKRDQLLQAYLQKNSDIEDSIQKYNRFFKPPMFITSFCWLFYRYGLMVVRDPKVQFYRILQKIAIGLCVGACYGGAAARTQAGAQAVQGALFLLVAENTFSPMYAALAALPDEMPLLARETRAGLYPTAAFYIARTLALFPGSLLDACVFVLVLYLLAGLRVELLALAGTMLLAVIVLNVATACGCFFSCAFESVPLAMACLVPFDYSLMITSGIFVKLGSLPSYVSWIRYISWLMYSTEAMSILQWEGVDNLSCDPSPSAARLPCLPDGGAVLQQYDFSASNLRRDFLALALLLIIFHLLTFICLHRKIRKK